MTDYGSDLSCTTDLDGLCRVVTGNELMAEVCVRRLYCPAGGLLSDPTDNTLDARDFLSADIGPGDLTRIQGLCAQALMGDPRILSAQVTAKFDNASRTLTLTINVVGALGPFTLTLSVTALTVELLRPA